jgi:CubicO group peptidase (beta-lactamase class C family)
MHGFENRPASFDEETSVDFPMTRTSAKRSSAIGTVLAAMAVLMAGCGASPESRPTPSEPTSKVDAPTTPLSPPLHPTSPIAGLGDFAELPQGSLPEPVAASLQAVLDEAVEQGTFRGLTAAVIVADSGSWSGAAGDGLEGKPLTPDAQLLTASLGKTVTAAQVLRLVEEGKLDLDDPISDYLPPEVRFFDTNEATIRDVLGMRSGIPDPPGYIELVDMGSTPAELLERVPRPLFPTGSEIEYANINYILLGMIIEHVTGRSLWEALRSGVLDRPGLDGLAYRVKGALAADGWRIESDPASLARWGYDLYGGFVISDASLRQMTDFQGEYYALGTIDFSDDFGVPAIGHGGLEPSNAAMLVAFPQTEVIVAVQAHIDYAMADPLPQVVTVVGALRDAAQP